jgi:hypothetical protein
MLSYISILFFVFAGSLALGAFFYEWCLQQIITTRKKTARNYPLRRKPLTGKDELIVWRWLEVVFDEYKVLINMNLTSFIEPSNEPNDVHWTTMMSMLEFQFTIVDHRSMAVGAIDLLKSGESGMREHSIKRELLKRADIPYWVIDQNRRPSSEMLRGKILATGKSSEALRRKAKEFEVNQRARAPSTASLALSAFILEQPRYSRLASYASEISAIGLTVKKLKSALGLRNIGKLLAGYLQSTKKDLRQHTPTRRQLKYTGND